MMRKRLLWRLLPILTLVAVFVLSGGKTLYADVVAPPSSSSGVVARDDFSGDINSLWNVLGTQVSVQREADGDYVQLTNSGNQVGTIWLKQTVAPPYTATFQFRITPSPFSGDIADGMVFMFNKRRNLDPASGGGMGFEEGNGYGIEFDTYLNTEDRVLYNAPPGQRYVHTALFKDTPVHTSEFPLKYKQLDTTNSVTIDNGVWHNVRVDVGTNSVRMYLDNQTTPYLYYEGVIDPTNSGIGFSASTGFYYSQQQIRDVTITKAIPLFHDAVLSPSASVPTTGNVTVAASVYGVDTSVTPLKWFPGRVVDPMQLQSGGSLFTDSFQASDNGTYTIFAQNLYGGSAVQYVQVTNIDRTKPTITYNGSTDITLTKGGIFTAPSFSLVDNYDTTDQLQVVSTGTVDMTTAGTYSVTYQARDRARNVSDPVVLTIHVVEPLVSNNAALSSLNVSGITLDQTVSGNVYTYTATVSNSVSFTSVTYTTANSRAAVALQLNGNPVNNPISLSVGSNVINMIVTALDGTTQTYTVTVNRASIVLSDLNHDGVIDIADVILTIKQNLNSENIVQLLKQISPKYVK